MLYVLTINKELSSETKGFYMYKLVIHEILQGLIKMP